jgi:hypothetical protein
MGTQQVGLRLGILVERFALLQLKNSILRPLLALLLVKRELALVPWLACQG